MAPTIPHPSRSTTASSSSSSFGSSDSDSDSDSVVQISSSSNVNVNNSIIVLSSSSSEDAPPPARNPRNLSWQFCDEVKILSAMAAHRAFTGRLPTPSVLLDSLLKDGVHLQRKKFTVGDLGKKVSNLKKKFQDAAVSSGNNVAGRGSRCVRAVALFKLSEKVWPELRPVLISSSSSSTA